MESKWITSSNVVGMHAITNSSPASRATLILELPISAMKFIQHHSRLWYNLCQDHGIGFDNGVKLVKLKKPYINHKLILTLHY
jgi:hypothetical protein